MAALLSAGRVAILTCALLALAACAGHRSVGAGFQPAHYKVARGDTLYSIAWRYQLDHESLIEWNHISPPYTIYPGQTIVLQPPQASSQEQTSLLRLPTPPGEETPAGGQPVKNTDARSPSMPAATTAPGNQSSPQTARAPAPGGWRWPTSGRVVDTFDSRNKRSLGIDIAGKPGQAVRASAHGRVVYSGSGLANYGNLIIIKHDTVFLSAYAHNRKLLVGEGANVAAGQVIAEMGRDDDDRIVLHFEIRKHGKPTDPLHYLPR